MEENLQIIKLKSATGSKYAEMSDVAKTFIELQNTYEHVHFKQIIRNGAYPDYLVVTTD